MHWNYKKGIGVLALAQVLLVVLFMGMPAHAAYTPNVTIDCNLDDAYEKISETENYTLYYANSEEHHFIFLNFTSNLSGKAISISSSEFSYDLSPEEVETSFLQSLHLNNSLELLISRSTAPSDITLTVEALEIKLHLIAPTPPPEPPKEEEEEKKDKKEEEKEVVDPIGDIYQFIEDNIVGLFILAFLLFVFLFILFYTYILHPIVYIRQNPEQGWKDLRLGKWIECYRAPKPLNNFYIHRFKNNFKDKNGEQKRGIREYYCRYPFEKLKEWFETKKLTYLEQYAGHIIPVTLTLEEHMRPTKMEPQTRKKRKHFVKRFGETRPYYGNYLRYALYKVIHVLFPSGKATNRAYEMVDYIPITDRAGEPIKEEEITLLVHEATLGFVTTVRDIEYNVKTFGSGKEEIKKRSEVAIPLEEIEALERDERIVPFDWNGDGKKTKINLVSDPYPQTKNYSDPAEAMKQIASKAELQAIHEIEIQDLLNEIERTKKKYYEANERLRSLKTKTWDKVNDALQERENESILTIDNLIHIVAKAMGQKQLTGKVEESITSSIKTFLEEKSAESLSELKIKVAQLKKENEILEKNLDQYRNLFKKQGNGRTITVRKETEEVKEGAIS